ncbi:MAG: hypothetical protein JWQ71_2375 [Pedosphaera sp.]|nr:hypothetical protein [Pedosphaera sp.]
MKGLLITIRRWGNGKMQRNHAIFTRVRGFSMMLAIMVGFALVSAPDARAEDGIALAIVYDTSGSMKESVPAGSGKYAPKYLIANKALSAIVDRINQFATNAPANAPRKIEAGLYIFHDASATNVVPFGPFNPAAMHTWIKNFSQPTGATPLGNSINVASKAVLGSNLSRKHIVIVTDGNNTSGPKPEVVIPGIKKTAKGTSSDISFHFVAFDVDAKVFEPVKKLGATVVGAADAQQLSTQLEFIFEKKILLEDEEPARPAGQQPK